jgi:hypothetical protein
VNPLLEEVQRNRFVLNAVANQRSLSKKEKELNERVRLYRVNNASDFSTAMSETKEQNRTMLVMSSL